jgi:hypothetical protein
MPIGSTGDSGARVRTMSTPNGEPHPAAGKVAYERAVMPCRPS